MPRKGRTSTRGRQGGGRNERRNGSCIRPLESMYVRKRRRARETGWVSAAPKKMYYREYPPRIPKRRGAFKSPEGILLTVTSIQRTERPGDARPPENRGHVTDPPHPDPWKQERVIVIPVADLIVRWLLIAIVTCQFRAAPLTPRGANLGESREPRDAVNSRALLRRLQQTGGINFVILYIKSLSVSCEHLRSLFRRLHCLLSATSALLSSSLSRCTLLVLTLSERRI